MSSLPPLPGPQTPGEGLPEVIPSYQPPAGPGSLPRQEQDRIDTLMGTVDRIGRYPLARTTKISAGMSTVRLDLREVLRPGETVAIALAAWGSTVRIAVPPGTEVDLQVNARLGDARLEVDGKSQGAAPTGTRVVITGWSTMGDLRVRAFELGAKPRSGWKWTRGR